MALDIVLTVLVCVAIVSTLTLAGMAVQKRGVDPKGAAGTLGSALAGFDPATGTPTHSEALAAREEQKRKRHEAPSAGPGPEANGPYSGRIRLPAAPLQAPAVPVQGPDSI
ncbi:hypothetical protein [Arthrobacter sp. SAFR-014]|uniref:hypothetical protein n=1 Tax=unclassified Arthrobacter TaxID=235627 RepID=UPI003F7BB4DD